MATTISLQETATELEHIEIYTDGACEPNPGPGGYAAVLLHPKKRAETTGGFRLTTNNRMEIYAAIKGLEMLKRPCRVTLYSDSQYLVNAMMAGWVTAWKKRGWWRTNKERAVNADLWEKLLGAYAAHQVKFVWVQGHAGNKENERCDTLSCAALRQPGLPADEGYENKPATVGGRPRVTQEGQPCWKCATPVVKQQARKQRDRDYYFDYYLYCPKCHATYMVEQARHEKPQTPSLL